MAGPLGKKKTPAQSTDELEERWFPVPGKPHLLQNARGQWKTNLKTPPPGPPKGTP